MRLKYVCSILVVYLYPKFQNQFFSYFREDAGGGGEGEGGVEVVTWNKSSESNRKKKKKKGNRLKPKLNQRLYNLEKLNAFREREALVLHRKSVGSLSLGLYLVIVFSSVISA